MQNVVPRMSHQSQASGSVDTYDRDCPLVSLCKLSTLVTNFTRCVTTNSPTPNLFLLTSLLFMGSSRTSSQSHHIYDNSSMFYFSIN